MTIWFVFNLICGALNLWFYLTGTNEVLKPLSLICSVISFVMAIALVNL